MRGTPFPSERESYLAGNPLRIGSRRTLLIDDFFVKRERNSIHVLNAPSPAATASLAIGEHISEMAIKHFGLAEKAEPQRGKNQGVEKKGVKKKKRKSSGKKRKSGGGSKKKD